MKKIMLVISVIFTILILSACNNVADDQEELKVVTTLFPQYDMVRSLAGDNVDLTLTLPPGMSAHTYEPTPKMMATILGADLFIYSSDMLEPWVKEFLDANDTGNLTVLNLSEYVVLLEGDDHEGDEHDHSHEIDPHYWSDPLNAKLMINQISRELTNLLVDDIDLIIQNKEQYLSELDEFHEEFQHLEESRESDILMHAGHHSIGYFIDRYDLTYINPYEGFSTDAEPTPARIADMINMIEEYQIDYVFSETLVSQTVANTISEQTGASILYLYSMGNISKDEFEAGLTFLEMMNHNLIQYRIGLGYDETDHAH